MNIKQLKEFFESLPDETDVIFEEGLKLGTQHDTFRRQIASMRYDEKNKKVILHGTHEIFLRFE